ncbi:hypothetical protein AVEN_255069-1 [Araneus ventricosus]|uniref:Uncharacterized protein n=1 Tax=Araneus ventricosus TaxID=182803 RepID=A0A4Y2JZS2_ARAVE|nr:hypothetical protein AVEN_255069-1 [Araneus ventricosus]
MPIEIKLQIHPVRDKNSRSYSWLAGELTTTLRRKTRDGDKLIYLSFNVAIALVAPSSGVKINQVGIPQRAGVRDPPPTLQDLQRRNTDSCVNVTPAMLHRVQREVEARVQMCIVADGKKFEYRK